MDGWFTLKKENNLVKDDYLELKKELQNAYRDLNAAAQFFDCVVDEKLVDYALKSIDAAEAKVNYLLTRVKEIEKTLEKEKAS